MVHSACRDANSGDGISGDGVSRVLQKRAGWPVLYVPCFHNGDGTERHNYETVVIIRLVIRAFRNQAHGIIPLGYAEKECFQLCGQLFEG
jgi:hypothetical protein